MNFLKILLLLLWIICTAIFVLVFLTPLEFTNKYLLFSSFLIAFNGIFFLKFLLTSFVSPKWNKIFLGFIISITLLLSFYLFPGFYPQWETENILFHDKKDSSIVVVRQKVESIDGLSNQRIIKIVPITPYFNWVTEVKTIVNMDETRWRRVSESEE